MTTEEKKTYQDYETLKQMARRDVVKEFENLREELADLEHKQWAHWTAYFLQNLTEENKKKWLIQIATPYFDLSEKEKDNDRHWADRVLRILKILEEK